MWAHTKLESIQRNSVIERRMISRLQTIAIRIKADQNSRIRSAKGLVNARPAASGTAEYGRPQAAGLCQTKLLFGCIRASSAGEVLGDLFLERFLSALLL